MLADDGGTLKLPVTVIDGLRHPTLLIDAGGRLARANAAAEALLGARATLEVGTPLQVIAPGQRAAPLRAAVGEILAGGPGTRRLDAFPWPGSARWFAADVVAAGDLVVVVLSAAPELEATCRAEQAASVLGRVLGHDIKAPITGLVMVLSGLRRRISDSRAIGSVDMAVRSVHELTHELELLRDYVHLHLGSGLPLSRSPAELGVLAQKAAQELRDNGAGPRLQVVRRGDDQGSWDARRLHRLLLVLGAKAAGAGPDGCAELVLDGRDADEVRIEVSLGPAELAGLDRLEVEAADLARRAMTPSALLGLDLYVAERIVAAHGGSLQVEPRGGDVTIRVALPRGAGAPAEVS